MSVAALSAEQEEIVTEVAEFVDCDVIPVTSELEHADEYPEQLVAKMPKRTEATRLLTIQDAQKKASGEPADIEAGMAKYFSPEGAQDNSLYSMRIQDVYGYSTEFNVERLYHDRPPLLIGEGSNEIQQPIIARRLLEKHAI